MEGTSIPTVRQALVATLEARPGMVNVNVSDQAPVKATDLRNEAGEFDAVWLGDADITHQIVVFNSLPLTFDESYRLDVAVQVLRRTTDGTQAACDARASAILAEVLGALVSDPTLGIETFARCEVTPQGSARYISGPLPSKKGFGTRFELRLNVEARLSLT